MWSHVRPQCVSVWVPCWEKGSWQKYPRILTSTEWNIYLTVFGFPFPMRSREELLCCVLSCIDFRWTINYKPSRCSALIHKMMHALTWLYFSVCILQALEYLFKFIVQSRILYSRATCGMEEEQFRASIQELFQSIRFVLSLDSRSSENLVFTQVR